MNQAKNMNGISGFCSCCWCWSIRVYIPVARAVVESFMVLLSAWFLEGIGEPPRATPSVREMFPSGCLRRAALGNEYAKQVGNTKVWYTTAAPGAQKRLLRDIHMYVVLACTERRDTDTYRSWYQFTP